MAYLNLLFLLLSFSSVALVDAFAITGVQGGVNTSTGQRPFRMNFLTFQNSGPAYDLYILSLQQLQQQGKSNLLSYYQVAGRASFSSLSEPTTLICASRHPRTSIHPVGRRQGSVPGRLLYARLDLIPILAPTVPGLV